MRCGGINGQENEREQTASDEAFGIILQLRNEANADDINDPSTFRQLQYLTAAALNGILANINLKIEEGRQDVEDQSIHRKTNYHHPIFTAHEGKEQINALIKAIHQEPRENLNQPTKLASQSENVQQENQFKKEDPARPPGTELLKGNLAKQLNSEQLQVWQIFDDYFQQLATSKITGQQRPKPPRVFVHGGPGVGKTFLINAIHESMEKHGFSSSSCALTGVASGALPDKRTMHSTFGIKVGNKKQQDLQSFMELTNTELINVRARFNLESLELFVLDELSTIGTEEICLV